MVKHLSGQVQHEFDGNLHAPTGWAILKVDSVDPKLNGELDSFISTLEKINQPSRVKAGKGDENVLTF
jgi:hypothetical protein